MRPSRGIHSRHIRHQFIHLHLLQQRKAKQKARKEAKKKKKKANKMNHIRVWIQLWSGRLIAISINPDQTLHEMSKKISMKEGIPTDQQLLFYNGIKLEVDDAINTTILESNIQNNSKLILTLRNRGG